MADVVVTTALEGFEEAIRSFDEFDKQIKKVSKSGEELGKQTKQADGAFGDLNSTMAGLLTRYVSIGAAVTFVTSTLIGSFRAAMEAREANLRLEAVLKATGNAAGLTATQLDTMADRLRATTTYDTSGIKQAMSIMLTFRSVQGETFERALGLSADLAAMFRMDLTTAARMVGRALESPSQSLGMLSRFIGRLSPEQERMIKLFMEQGKQAEAASVILDVMTQKVGGLSAKLATDGVTSLQRFARAWKDIEQEMGAVFTTRNLDRITKWMEAFVAKSKAAAEQREKDMLAADQEIINSAWATEEEKQLARQRTSVLLNQIDQRDKAEKRKREEADASREAAAAENSKQLEEDKAKKTFQLAMARLDLEIAVDQKTLADRLKMLDARLAATKKAVDQETLEEQQARLQLEGERAKTISDMAQLARARVDLAVQTNQKELEALLEHLQKDMAARRMGATERIKLEQDIFNVQEAIRNRNLEREEAAARSRDASLDEEAQTRRENEAMVADVAAKQVAGIQRVAMSYDELIARLLELRAVYDELRSTQQGQQAGDVEGYKRVNEAITAAKEAREAELQTMRRALDPMIAYNEQVAKLDELQKRGWITQVRYNDEIAAAKKAYEAAVEGGEKMSEWQSEMLRLTRGFGQEFTEAIVRTLEGATDAFSDFREALIRMFRRTVIDQFITKPLEEALNEVVRTIRRKAVEAHAAGGSFWDIIARFAASYVMGGAVGGSPETSTAARGSEAYVDTGSVQARPLQHGGLLPRGFMGLVGEAGPELVVPAGTSRVIPNEMLSGNVVIHQTFQAGVSRAELASLLPQIKADTIAGVMEARQRGGRFSRAFR